MQAKSVLDGVVDELSQVIPLFYKGPLNSTVLDGIGGYIRKMLKDKPEIGFKLFSIFIELAQNIYYHSDDAPGLNEGQNVKFGVLLIEEKRDSYIITSGNYASLERVQSIKSHCEKINSLSLAELRIFKRERRMMDRGTNGEANIGLIQVALTSEEPIFCDSYPVGEDSCFFTLSTEIKKLVTKKDF